MKAKEVGSIKQMVFKFFLSFTLHVICHKKGNEFSVIYICRHTHSFSHLCVRENFTFFQHEILYD